MEMQVLRHHFRRIGADLSINLISKEDWRWRGVEYTLDMEQNRKGSLFHLAIREDVLPFLEMEVLNLRRDLRALILMVKQQNLPLDRRKQRFLCAYDERHWFAADMPRQGRVTTVEQAMETLKPRQARLSQLVHKTRGKVRNRRRNPGFVRQGEWFFIPRPEFMPRDEGLILHNEPIRRPRGRPHIVEWLYRVGGETVYVSNRNDLSRRGLTEKEYRQLLRENPIAQGWGWRLMRRNPRAYAKGKVRHADHRTIELPFWHRVVISNEQGNGNNVFLD